MALLQTRQAKRRVRQLLLRLQLATVLCQPLQQMLHQLATAAARVQLLLWLPLLPLLLQGPPRSPRLRSA